ncbi:IS66 family transposase [Pyxidicoccus caerfyrddinensis]|uniref:IS66 family transposase n=1 Tax=Pyxidicoccus caerfyrddinensis TaxID=2709663 RepID=UPI003B82DB9D
MDGYTGYNPVTLPDGRTRVGCWAHARRRFFDALATAPEARESMDLILAGERGLSGRVPNEGCTASPPAWRTARRHPSASLFGTSAPAPTLNRPSLRPMRPIVSRSPAQGRPIRAPILVLHAGRPALQARPSAMPAFRPW